MKVFAFIVFLMAVASSAHARQYGKVLSVHSGDTNAAGELQEECHAKILMEPNSTESEWLKVKAKGDPLHQPTGCSMLLAAYMADQRIGFDLTENKFYNICLAGKINC